MTSGIKEIAKQLIRELPENATWDYLMYRIYVRQKIEAGLQATEKSCVVLHEDAGRKYDVEQVSQTNIHLHR